MPRPTGRQWVSIVAIGVLWFGIYNVALNAGEQRVDAGTAAMLIQVSPVLIAVLAAVFLNERFTVYLGRRLALAFAGVGLISLSADSAGGGGRDVLGVVLCLLSAVVYSISLILQKPLVARLPAIQVTWLACTVGAVVCLPFLGQLLDEARAAPASSSLWLVYLGVFPTAIAFTTYAYALRHMSASSLGVTTYLVPPITIVMGWCSSTRRRPRWPTSVARSPWSASPSPAASRGRSPRRPHLPPDVESGVPTTRVGRRLQTRSSEVPTQRCGGSSPDSSQPRNASRFRVDSPRSLRHSHSLRIEEAKPSSRIVLNDSSA